MLNFGKLFGTFIPIYSIQKIKFKVSGWYDLLQHFTT